MSNPIPRIISSRRYRRVTNFIQARPFSAFFISLGVLLLLIILGTILSNLGKKETTKAVAVRDVHVFRIGKTPTVNLEAQVENKGIAKIVSQGAGIVSQINATEGKRVAAGQTIISLSSNYQGGNAPTLQAQLANAQYKNTLDTYQTQKDILDQQRNVATASAENTEQLRQISESSLNETRDLLSANDAILNNLTTQITTLQQMNPNDPTIQTLRGQQVQLQGGVNQLRSTVRQLEYQTNTSNPPTTLTNAQEEIALKQLDVQQKALDLGKEVSGIQNSLAVVAEDLMFPASPFAGVVERVNVQVGQSITPGTALATVTADNHSSQAVLRVPREIAESLSQTDPTIFHINSQQISVLPTYISTVATDGELHTVLYDLPSPVAEAVTDGQYVSADVPIGVVNTSSTDPFVPIDSLVQSQNESTVFVVQNNKAVARKVTTGQVYGDFVEVLAGLRDSDQVILDRNVVAGDPVKIVR